MDVLKAPLPGAATSREQLLAFAERQARPLLLRIPTDGDDRERVPVRPTGPSEPLPPNLHRLLAHAPYPEGRVAPGIPVPQRVLGTVAASAPQRFEVRSAVNPHRAYPAAHCFYSAQLFLLADDAAWHYDAAGHRLARLAGWAGLDRALSGGARLEVVCHLGSIPTRYRELRWGLSLCEAGHLLELLARTAAAHRLTARTLLEGSEEALLERLGLRGEDGWVPAGGIELRPDADQAVPEPARPGPSWADVLFERTAGRANKGFAPAPAPLGREAVEEVLRAVGEATAAVPPASEGGLDVVLLARDAAGLRPGCYRLAPGLPPQPVPGPDMDLVQRHFSYPPTQMAISGCPAALLMVGDHEAAIRAGGERGLRRLQLRMGAVAQAAGMAITPHGGFLRPARSFDPEPLAAALELPPTRLPVYLALMGTNRFTDLLLDVRR